MLISDPTEFVDLKKDKIRLYIQNIIIHTTIKVKIIASVKRRHVPNSEFD